MAFFPLAIYNYTQWTDLSSLFFFLEGGGHLGNQIGKYSDFKEIKEGHKFKSQLIHIFFS